MKRWRLKRPPRVLDLFSGCGGFSLGLERAGMRTVAFCEKNPASRAVLREHWPHVPIFDDITELTVEQLDDAGVIPDVIVGGFPCKGVSSAGRREGFDHAESALWREQARLLGLIRPWLAIVENPASLLERDGGSLFGEILWDLAEIGFDAEWHCIPAAAVDAPHIRDRVWIIAYPSGASRTGWRQPCAQEVLADADCSREPQSSRRERRQRRWAGDSGGDVPHAHLDTTLGPAIARQECRPWAAEPAVGRVVNGLPGRVDRVSILGDSLVPQIPELIGRAIMEAAQ